MALRVELSDFVGQGSFARVFNVSPDTVAKVFLTDLWYPAPSSSKSDLAYEATVMRALYNGGVFVPKPYGIRDIIIEGCGHDTSVPGLLMDRIHGRTIYSLSRSSDDERLFDYATALWNAELTKAKQICTVEDAHDENAIYDPQKGKVFLIDFDGWTLNRNALVNKRAKRAHADIKDIVFAYA